MINTILFEITVASPGFCLAPGSGTNALSQTRANVSFSPVENQTEPNQVVPAAPKSCNQVLDNQRPGTSKESCAASAHEREPDYLSTIEKPLELTGML